MYPYYDEEQAVMAEAVARAAEGRSRTAPLHAWPHLAEMGLSALALAQADGGMQASARTLHAVAEALGRSLQVSPFATSAVAATRLLERLGAPATRQSLLPLLASGDAVLALALAEPQTDYDLAAIRTRIVPAGAGWVLDGRKIVVLHSERAERWIVSARDPHGEPALVLVQEGAPGVTVRRYDAIDGSAACDLVFDRVAVSPTHLLGEPGAVSMAALGEAVALAELALTAESAGIQARLLQDTVRYVKERRQFGVALGRQQAVQHRLADMLVALEQARTLAWLLACEFETASQARRDYLVSAAKVRGIASARLIGMQSIHLHGGMGMTDELPIGHGVKRLLAIEHSFGDERHHLNRLASSAQEAGAVARAA